MKVLRLLLVLALAGGALGAISVLAKVSKQGLNARIGQTPSNQKSQEGTAAPAHPARHHVVLLRSGPNYVKGHPPQDQPGFAAHAEHISRLTRAGTLVLGGPFVEDFSSMTATGAMLVLATDTKEAARRIAEADPFVVSGILEVEEIRPFVLAATSLRPADTPPR